MSDSFDKVIDDFFAQGMKEIDNYLDNLGKEAVEVNKQQGNYRDRTGNLRRSNYYKVEQYELTIGNKASYANDVSNKGYDVIDSGVQYIRTELEDKL